MKKAKPQKVLLVGAGPGDPGLITVRGLEALAEADVVIYDALVNRSLLNFAPRSAEKIFAGRRKGLATLSQKQTNRLMAGRAKQGKAVVRLKGGDPFVFGRGGEEAQALAEAGVEFEIVPGVSSAYSVPAYAGVPLTHRDFNSSFIVATGHEKPGKKPSALNWKQIASAETAVFLMSLDNIGEIAKKLVKLKKPRRTPVMATSHGTTGRQKTVVGNLENIADRARSEGITAPAVIIAGKAVGMRDALNWFEKKPLFGRNIVVTRPAAQCEEFAKILRRQGAEVSALPCIEIVPPLKWKAADALIDRLKQCDFLAFTSPNGVERFFTRLRKKGLDARALADIKTVCIGSKTAKALEKRGITADIVPAAYTGAATVLEMKKHPVKGKMFFLPGAEKAGEVFPRGLREMGARVKTAPCYRTRTARLTAEEMEAAEKEMESRPPDMVVFTSSSSVRGFLEIFKNARAVLNRCAVACIGPVTAQAVTDAGFTPAVVASKHTTEGLADSISRFFREKS